MYKIYSPDSGRWVSDLVYAAQTEAIDAVFSSLDEDEEIPDWTVENLDDETDSLSLREIGNWSTKP